MGNGMCSRKLKGLLQTGFCVLVVLCFGFGFYTYTLLKENVRGAEMLAQKYKQQQESVSAQLQVVYEHRSRLERSLQKERGEHKKTKEDFLVYKLEAQESLNKEKQDAMNRYGALSSQHKILKNQHDEIRKQLRDLQLQHNSLQLEHRKVAESHNQHYLQLHQQKELEISTLQDSIFKLKHESKQLRRAHQDMHQQLAEAQGQQPLDGLMDVGERPLTPQHNGELGVKEALAKDQPKEPLQERSAHRGVPVWDAINPVRPHAEGPNRVLRFTRTVNSLQPDSQDTKVKADGVDQTHGVTVEQDHILLEGETVAGKQETLITSEKKSDSRTINHQTKVKRWDEITNDLNRGTDFKLHSQMELLQIPLVQNHQAIQTPPIQITRRHWSPRHQNANWHLDRVSEAREEPEGEDERTDNELDEVGTNDAEKLLLHAMSTRSELIVQEPLIPDGNQDPAEDPNNQGEDEFEEAELERPGFAGKVAGLHGMKEQQLLIKSGLKGVDAASKEEDEAVDEYQEDQEAENEDNGGEIDDDHEDPGFIHQDANEGVAGIVDDEGNKEEDY
ncbi:Golgi integral membrane protein 4-like isoform X4 [Heterodontus francisci]|uniref:Golgi integral membrane protein 4-like isoform X4 n=1 Tax=Heterodontus francisci TaxID=7792 RepID=UPI00355C0FE7